MLLNEPMTQLSISLVGLFDIGSSQVKESIFSSPLLFNMLYP
jgi:hypothetical protein